MNYRIRANAWVFTGFLIFAAIAGIFAGIQLHQDLDYQEAELYQTAVYTESEFVFEVCDKLEKYYYDPEAIRYPKLLNVALDGIAQLLKTQEIEFVPRKIEADAPEAQAKLKFTTELDRAKMLATQKVSFGENALAFTASEYLLKSLKSSHTGFLNPERNRERIKKEIGQNSFSGIGASIRKLKEDLVYIAEVYSDSPAEKAGLRRFDRIIAIDGKPAGTDVKDIVARIRGTKGTSVALTVERLGSPIDIKVTRGDIKAPIFGGRLVEKNGKKFACLKLHDFSRGASHQMSNFLRANRSVDGIILDLRGNPGGYVAELMVIMEFFLPPDTPVFISQDKNGKTEHYTDAGSRALVKSPMVVLIDGDSSSASEISAAALKENKRATVAGVTSAGAVEVGIVESLPHSAAMHIAIRQVFTPRGNSMEKNGVAPDVTVEITKDDILNARDTQLEKAIELLLK